MALYAFDGTWNEDDDIEDIHVSTDTNVSNFVEAYIGQNEYVSGVGTRYGFIGRALGGLFGAGGKTRIKEMYERFTENYQAGDKTIDIIGYSRGAALAVHFANVIENRGVSVNDTIEYPSVRFLGIWDMVGSFGIPRDIVFDFQELNIGYDLTLSKNVEHCYHAMAMDERRDCFKITRLNADSKPTLAEEVWFKGVHGDVGGGALNPGLENISLYWMFQNAIACGIELNSKLVDQAKNARNETAAISTNRDFVVGPKRDIRGGDLIHASAKKTLASSDQLLDEPA